MSLSSARRAAEWRRCGSVLPDSRMWMTSMPRQAWLAEQVLWRWLREVSNGLASLRRMQRYFSFLSRVLSVRKGAVRGLVRLVGFEDARIRTTQNLNVEIELVIEPPQLCDPRAHQGAGVFQFRAFRIPARAQDPHLTPGHASKSEEPTQECCQSKPYRHPVPRTAKPFGHYSCHPRNRNRSDCERTPGLGLTMFDDSPDAKVSSGRVACRLKSGGFRGDGLYLPGLSLGRGKGCGVEGQFRATLVQRPGNLN